MAISIAILVYQRVQSLNPDLLGPGVRTSSDTSASLSGGRSGALSASRDDLLGAKELLGVSHPHDII